MFKTIAIPSYVSALRKHSSSFFIAISLTYSLGVAASVGCGGDNDVKEQDFLLQNGNPVDNDNIGDKVVAFDKGVESPPLEAPVDDEAVVAAAPATLC